MSAGVVDDPALRQDRPECLGRGLDGHSVSIDVRSKVQFLGLLEAARRTIAARDVSVCVPRSALFRKLCHNFVVFDLSLSNAGGLEIAANRVRAHDVDLSACEASGRATDTAKRAGNEKECGHLL